MKWFRVAVNIASSRSGKYKVDMIQDKAAP